MGKLKTRKKGWKKLPRSADEEIGEVHRIQHLKEIPDSQLFFLDSERRKCEQLNDQLTFRQKAALEYRRERAEKVANEIKKEESIDYEPEFKHKKSKTKYKNSTRFLKSSKTGPKEKCDGSSGSYDLWDQSETAEPTLSKKTYIPSILPAVRVPDEGASYNPPLSSYLEYVNKIANEEAKFEAVERRIDRMLELRSTSQKTQGLHECFFHFTGDSDDEPDVLNDDVKDQDQPSVTKKPTKPKTAKQKRKACEQTLMELQQQEKKLHKRNEQQISNVKTLSKQVRRSLEEQSKKADERRKKLGVQRLTKRKRLGRGRYEPYLEPVLLANELTPTLRQLKPQGDIFQERVSSLQERNILPIAGQRSSRRLKLKLKSRFVEKRSAKDVTADSRVI